MQFLYVPKVGNSIYDMSKDQQYSVRLICVIIYEDYEVVCYADRNNKKIITEISNSNYKFKNYSFDTNDWEMHHLQKVIYSVNWILLLTVEGIMLACGNNCNYQIGLESNKFSCILTRVLPGIQVDNFSIFPYGDLEKQYIIITTKSNNLYAAGINTKNRMGIGKTANNKSCIPISSGQIQLPVSGELEIYELRNNYSIILIDKVKYYSGKYNGKSSNIFAKI